MLKNIYKGSTMNVITTVYKDHNWLPWKFKHVTKHFWLEMENQRNFLDWVALQLNYNDKEDWYNITSKVFFKLRLFFLKLKY